LKELEDRTSISNGKVSNLSVDVELLSNMYREMCDKQASQHAEISQLQHQKELFTEKINQLLSENKKLRAESKRSQKIVAHSLASRSRIVGEHEDVLKSIRLFNEQLNISASLGTFGDKKVPVAPPPSLDVVFEKLSRKMKTDESEIKDLKEQNQLLQQKYETKKGELASVDSKLKALELMQDEVTNGAVENTRRVLQFQLDNFRNKVDSLTNDKHSLEIELHNVKMSAAKQKSNRVHVIQKLTRRGSIMNDDAL
jgi:chromosome segregation ATPase